ncbi:MAG: hypothetical protein U5K79_13025 [Cyclobacteriaceae bacterium]|nr:hypothetical protein [Cyclobacteriaceae bacterium]
MKKVLLFIVLVGFFVNAQAQKLKLSDVPVTVTKSFNTSYPTIQDAEWTKDGNNYNAGFEENKLSRSVTYAATGVLVGTSEEITVSEVPVSALEYIKKSYEGSKFHSVSRINNADGTVTYKAEMDRKDLFFTSEGNFLKSVDN